MKQHSQYLKIAGLLFFGSFLSIFFSCKSTTPTEVNLGNSKILLVNSAANSQAINMYYTGNKLNSVPLVYGSTTGYRNITSGKRDVQIKANSTNAILASGNITLVRDSSYTFFVYENKSITSTVIAEDDLSIPSFGNAKLKFANMSSGFSSADLVITNGPTIISGIGFGTIGSYIELKAGIYNLALRLHGSNTVLLNLPNIKLDNAKTYTMWSGGSISSNGTAALSIQTIIQ